SIELGGQHHLLASPSLREPAADDLLRSPQPALAAIAVRGIEEVDPMLEGAVHHGEAVWLCGLRAEVHRAQTQPADLQPRAAQRCVLHESLLCIATSSASLTRSSTLAASDA